MFGPRMTWRWALCLHPSPWGPVLKQTSSFSVQWPAATWSSWSPPQTVPSVLQPLPPLLLVSVLLSLPFILASQPFLQFLWLYHLGTFVFVPFAWRTFPSDLSLITQISTELSPLLELFPGQSRALLPLLSVLPPSLNPVTVLIFFLALSLSGITCLFPSLECLLCERNLISPWSWRHST